MRTLYLISMLMLQALVFANSETPRGTIRGTVTDRLTRATLPGANIILLNTTPVTGTTTDADGRFRMEGVEAGRISLKVTFVGYKEVVFANLLLNSGKELILNIELDEAVITAREVVISARADKTTALNQMTSVSARSFTIEETQRFAGSRNDVARMASGYAGVVGANDARNDIIIRGNSPIGLLWRLEGAAIPNPNHWGSSTATGGPVSILNNNVLSNSDFLTGAFPAEYGNALSGAFDLKLRNGNDEKHEFLGQIGFNGFEAGAEGPLSRSHNSSYLLNVRYSTMEVMEKLGADFGTGTGIPKYKDMVLKINLPKTRLGSFSVFAIGGISDIEIWDSRRDTLNNDKVDFYAGEGYDLTNGSDMLTGGVVNLLPLGRNTYLRSLVSGAYHRFRTGVDSLNPADVTDKTSIYSNDLRQTSLTVKSELTHRFSSMHHIKAGASVVATGFNLDEEIWFRADKALRTVTDYDGNTALFQSFAQWQFRPAENWSFTTGAHFMAYGLNDTWSLEPRAGIRWDFLPLHTLSLGYGYHSQLNPISIYFRQTKMPDGSYIRLNEALDMPKAHHFVAGYDWKINESTRLKLEAYAQWLRNAGVDAASPTYFSMLNQGANFGFWTPDSLMATGTGRNKGIELTLERFLSKGFYYLATVSLFDSKYKGSDGIERNTAFNGGHVANVLAGKEFALGRATREKKAVNVLAADVKYTWAGGQRYTPSSVVPDPATGGTTFMLEYDNTKAYSLKYRDYHRADLRISLKRNGRRITQEWAIDIQNLFDIKNIYAEKLNKKTGEKSFTHQMGILVIPQYRINF